MFNSSQPQVSSIPSFTATSNNSNNVGLSYGQPQQGYQFTPAAQTFNHTPQSQTLQLPFQQQQQQFNVQQQPQQVAQQQQQLPQQPSWFSNPKKRAIPQNIVKRSSKPYSEDSGAVILSSSGSSKTANSTFSGSKGPFGSISFGSKKANFAPSGNAILSSNTTRNNSSFYGVGNSSPILSATNNASAMSSSAINGGLFDSTDAPPSKSLFDCEREDEFGSISMAPTAASSGPFSSTTNAGNNGISSNKFNTMSSSSNVFTRDDNVHSANSSESSANINNGKLSSTSKSSQPKYYAIIVFGYPESISNQVISHFSKFGNILEDFEVCRDENSSLKLKSSVNNNNNNNNSNNNNNNTNNNNNNNNSDGSNYGRKYPIYAGNGWVKITYDNQTAAIRALQENGTIYGGTLLGCVPYFKDVIENLAQCKVDKVMDSNTGIPSISKKSQILSTDKEHINDNNGNDNKASEVTNAPLQPLLGKKLEVKDGKNLFVRNTSDFHYNGDGIKYNNNGEVGHGAIFKTLENNLQKDIEIISHKKTGLTGKLNNWLFGWGEL